jgi:hypothetical protein
MPHRYSERKISSGLYALQQYLRVEKLNQINLEHLVKTAVKSPDLTEAFHSILYRLSQLLTANAAGLNNELVRIRHIGKLRLNQPLYLPTPKELKCAGYKTKEINHRITTSGYIRRK